MKLGIEHSIDSAHHLPGHPKCGVPHGHTYKFELMVEGEAKEGMLMDFGEMKKSLKAVLGDYDHKSWNDFLKFPSVENIATLVHARLKEKIPHKVTVRVWEGEGKWAEI